MPGVAVFRVCRLQMLQYGNEQHNSIEMPETVPDDDDKGNLEESCEEDYYNRLFGTNESESSLDLYQDSVSSAGSPDAGAIGHDSKRSIGRPRNRTKEFEKGSPFTQYFQV